ncbi:hypothetical protein C8R45DRAFT_927896 [Mycena sanguinolenta]|nr:hypothetical protein C8R45DRAFT_927896 [Mycena sanguinolenta]
MTQNSAYKFAAVKRQVSQRQALDKYYASMGEVEISLRACAHLRAAGRTVEGRKPVRQPKGGPRTHHCGGKPWWLVLEVNIWRRNSHPAPDQHAAGHSSLGRNRGITEILETWLSLATSAGGWAYQCAAIPLAAVEDLGSCGLSGTVRSSCYIRHGEPPPWGRLSQELGSRRVPAAAVQKLDRRNAVGLAAVGNGMPPASRRNTGTEHPSAGA